MLVGCALSVAHVVWVGGDAFSGARFLAPWLPVLFVLALVGACSLARDAASRRGLAWLAASAALMGGLVIPVYWRRLPLFVSRNGGPAESLVSALAIRDNTPPDTRVAVHAAGVVPYFSRRYAIDWLGKSDRHVARLPPLGDRIGHNKIDAEHSLSEREADLAVMLWLPRGMGNCTAEQVAQVRQKAPAWVARVYVSNAFQRDFCGRVVEPADGVPIYLGRSYRGSTAPEAWKLPIRRAARADDH
jgi:hypothetical protein